MGAESIEDEADFHFWRAQDLWGKERNKEALSHLQAALQVELGHLQALVSAGELYLLRGEDLGLEEEVSDRIALGYFERALVQEPRHADAWSGKALTLLYMQRPQEALCAADWGLSVLPLRVGYAMTYAAVYTNVAEALFSTKVRALLDLDKVEGARQTLAAGLECCPGSAFLTRHVEAVTSLFNDTEAA